VGGKKQFAETHVSLRRSDRPDPQSNEEAFAQLTIAVKDPDGNFSETPGSAGGLTYVGREGWLAEKRPKRQRKAGHRSASVL
jgi:hypothetical protein